MAPRASLDDKLAAIRQLRGQALTPEQKAELRKRIGDRSNLVVAAAAAIAGENTLVELAEGSGGGLRPLPGQPAQGRQALPRQDRGRPGPRQDGAPGPGRLPEGGEARAARAGLGRVGGFRRALARGGRRRPGAGRRLRAPCPCWSTRWPIPRRTCGSRRPRRSGPSGPRARACSSASRSASATRDPDVLSECLGGLLAVDPRENLSLVTEFLEPSNPAACEAAALALGKSRLPEALDPLKACWQRCHSPELSQQVLLAIAILRRPGAIDYLMELVASETGTDGDRRPVGAQDLQERPASARADREARPGTREPEAAGLLRS